MYNLNVNRISTFSFAVEQESIIKGAHNNTETCLLLKHDSYWVIRQINHNGSMKTLSEIESDAHLISELEHLRFNQLIFFATETNAHFADFNNNKLITIKIPIIEQNDKAVAAAWNCEQDCLAVAFQSGRVQIFYVDYDCFELKLLAEDQPDHKADENVYLGWGDVKKQFKGKGGATYLNEFHPPASTYCEPSSKASISWQFGERFFAVNCRNNDERVIRIFDNECRLYHTITSQKVPGICFTTVYRSKRNTLATICQSHTDIESYVVLHERNGGYHTKITPTNNAKVQNIAFSNCGRYFAMESTDYAYRLDIYLQTNFLWVHKFRFRGSRHSDQRLINFKFVQSAEDLIGIELIYTRGVIIYELMKTLTSSNSCVFVQNSSSLAEFNYKQAVLPPCGSITDNWEHVETINNIVVHDSKRLLAVIDANETVSLLKPTAPDNNKWQILNQFKLRCESPEYFLPITWFQFTLTINSSGNDILVAIGCDPQDNSKSIQKIIDLDKDTITETICDRVAFLQNIINGTGFNVISAGNDADTAIKNAICLNANKDHEALTIALTTGGKLRWNNAQLSDTDGFTSMLNFKDLYLLLTVTKPDDTMDRLICVDLAKVCKENAENVRIADASWSRRIEKGATLISHGKDDGEIVLEMPRGNIELISVRPIILRQIASKLHEGCFYEAYHLVRRSAMKLDLLYDLAPRLFIENIDTFVASLGNTESVIKFLLPLRGVSTLTPDDKLFLIGESLRGNEAKKEDICDAIIKSYQKNCDLHSIAYCRVICIALLVKHNQSTLEPLRFLMQHHKGWYSAQSLRRLADAISLLKRYGDANEMYRQAVGLYDIELASTIAQVSGMDPQIYRRFLETCHNSDPITRRFQMANEAGNVKAAGLHLLILHRNKCKSAKELLEYVLENDCLEDVYAKMNKFDGDAFTTATNLVVDRYLAKFMYKQAAAVLCKAGMHKKALEYLIRGNCWPEAIDFIKITTQFDDEEKSLWFSKVAESCCVQGRFKEAAWTYLDQCKDVSKALDCLLSGYCFKECVELLRKQDSFIYRESYDEKLKGALSENLKSTQISADKLEMNFHTHYERLKIVRESRKQRAEHCVDGDDAYSESGSLTTRSHTSASTVTRRTRKLEVKLRSLRQGGKFEDVALMRELFEIITSVFNLGNDMKTLYDIYVDFAGLQPKDINNKLALLQTNIKHVVNDIWLPDYSTIDDIVLIADFSTENIVFLSPEHRSKPSIVDDPDYNVVFM